MYPHQVLMDEHGLSKEDLSKEAQEYLKDFNHYHRGISLKESRAIKAGKEFNLSDSENSKLNRFSKSVAIKIYEDLQVVAEAKRAEEEKERKIKEEATELAKQQLEEDARIKAENEAKKAKEEEKQRLKEEEDQKLYEEEKRLQEEKEEEEQRLKEEEEIKLEREKQVPPKPKPVEKDEGTGLFDYFF